MKKEKKLMILVLVLVAVMAGAFFLYNKLLAENTPDVLAGTESSENSEEQQGSSNSSSQTESEPDYSAPDFTVVDGDGNEVSLSDFIGTPIVLNFWASWCGPCKSEMPAFQEAYQKYDHEVVFLLINLTDGYQETLDSAKSFIEKNGYTFPVYYDTEQDAAYTYYVNAIPATYFIDKNGELITWANSALDLATLEKGIGMILPE